MNTRQFPRTLNQAFGPYASGPIHPMREPSFWTPIRVALVAVYSVAIFTVICLLAWGPK